MKKILLGLFCGLFFASFTVAQTNNTFYQIQIWPFSSIQVVPIQPPQRENSLSLQIMPGLPDPNSGKIYRLQVGSFKMPEAAQEVARLLRSSGFNVILELYGSFYRVIITDVPAAMVYPALQRLAYLGIKQVWIKQ